MKKTNVTFKFLRLGLIALPLFVLAEPIGLASDHYLPIGWKVGPLQAGDIGDTVYCGINQEPLPVEKRFICQCYHNKGIVGTTQVRAIDAIVASQKALNYCLRFSTGNNFGEVRGCFEE